jgi:hypothetical protein
MTRRTFMVRATLLVGDERVEWVGDVGNLPCTGDEPTALLAARLAAAVLTAEREADDFASFTYTRIA